MGKVRAKDIKKRVGGDFKRKKAKVGRKVERSNVTKISVVSKRITLPLQASLCDINKDETVRIDGLIRLMQHHGSRNRAAALQELQEIFEGRSNARRYLGVTMPHVLELLFDGTAEVHRAMISLLSSLLSRYTAADFSSVAPVLVTYICSGLTSLNLAIRKDTLVALHTVCDTQPALLMTYAEKIFDHLLTLIENSFVESSAKDSYSTGVDVVANASAQVTAKVVSVATAKRKKQESADKKSAQKKAHGNSVLLLSLKIFSALLSSFMSSRMPVLRDIETDIHAISGAQLRSCRKNCLLFSVTKNVMDISESPIDLNLSAENTQAGGTKVNTGAMSLSSPVLLKMCIVLRKVWAGYMPQDPAPLPVKLEVALRAIADVIGHLVQCVCAEEGASQSAVADELRKTVYAFTAQYPYTVMETSCVESRKKKLRKITAEADVQSSALHENGCTEIMESDDESLDDDSVEFEHAAPVASSGILPSSFAPVDDNLLRESKKRFKVLNILISETVLRLYSDKLCEKFINTIPRERRDTLNFLKSYQQVQAYVGSELCHVVTLLDQYNYDRTVEFDLTPKEYYQLLFNCHRLSYVQSNDIATVGFSAMQLVELSPGATEEQHASLASSLSTLVNAFLRLGTAFHCKGYIPFVESCIRCVCVVAEETVAQRSHILNNESIGAEGSLILRWDTITSEIISALSAAMSLMRTFPNEPGVLTDLIANSSVRFISSVDVNDSPKVAAALKKFQLSTQQVFRPGSQPETALYKTADGDDKTALYTDATLRTRLRLLDLWVASAPSEGFIQSAEDVMDCIRAMIYEERSEGAVSSSEISYFLRLFHMRRQDASLSDFKDFVFNSIDAVGATFRELIEDMVQASVDAGKHTRASVNELFKHVFGIINNYTAFVNEIFLSITRCSSPEQPHKLLSRLLDPVAALITALEQNSQEADGVCRTGHLFVAAANAAGIFAISKQLLSCGIPRNYGTVENADTDVHYFTTQLIDLTAKLVFIVIVRLQLLGGSEVLVPLDEFVVGGNVATQLTPTFLIFHKDVGSVDLLSFLVSGICKNTFAVFNAFLRHAEVQWGSLNIETKLALLKTLKEFYRRNEFESCIDSSRLCIESFIGAVKSKETNVDVLENSDRIVRFISSSS